VLTTAMIQTYRLPYLQQLVQRPVRLKVHCLSCSGKESMAAHQRHRVMFAKGTVTKTKIVWVDSNVSNDLMESILKSLVAPLGVVEILLERIIAMILLP